MTPACRLATMLAESPVVGFGVVVVTSVGGVVDFFGPEIKNERDT